MLLAPTEKQIRDLATELFEKRGSVQAEKLGEFDDWFQAKANLLVDAILALRNVAIIDQDNQLMDGKSSTQPPPTATPN